MKNGELRITVADNWRVIATPATNGGRHDGLGNIRKRMKDLGGRFELSSDPSCGTSLVLHVPLSGSGRIHAS